MSSSAEQVLELSVEETNKLRAKLGLPPLRGAGAGGGGGPAASPSRPTPAANTDRGEEAVLELSVDDTNALREKLGLPPLRAGSGGGASSSRKEVVHAPAANEGERREAEERLERARVERQVKQGIREFESHKGLGEDDTSAQSWARQMRSGKASGSGPSATDGDKGEKEAKKGAKGKSKASSKTRKKGKNDHYDEDDLKGLKVAHALSELEEGKTTVLTLADTSLLKTSDDHSKKVIGLGDEDEGPELENVNLADQQKQRDGLREKRRVEMGMGRAGGYSGFDDEEFEELGGSQAPSRAARGVESGPGDKASKRKRVQGFQIGALLEEQEAEQESDLFAAEAGKAVSLEPSQADVVASDFMTIDEDEAERVERKKKKKDATFKKKSKKDKKKKKKNRRAESDEDEDDEPAVQLPPKKKKGLLEELEETAVVESGTSRKRRRSEDDEDILPSVETTGSTKAKSDDAMDVDGNDVEKAKAEKRVKFDAVMAKGNERTKRAFQTTQVKQPDAKDLDEGPDDAFLNAALAKARRLNRLKQMAESKKAVRGADAVVQAVQSTQQGKSAVPDSVPSIGGDGGADTGTVTFSVDETREFTRALRARAEQTSREQAKKDAAKKADTTRIKREAPSEEFPEKMDVDTGDGPEADLEELAKEVKEDEEHVALDGSTHAMGRGLGSVLGMLRQTGELGGKNAGKEEMRGRAKDKRTYEDYEALDLSKVVKIDERTATDRDKDLAHREIKLEYRDKDGRLLTRKEAFRDLSYQFHGYGSGKRKEAKRKEQIAREQAEARLASRQAAEDGAEGGMFGALKATQKATGKAFVIHKT